MISFNLTFSDLDDAARRAAEDNDFFADDVDADYALKDGFLFVRIFEDFLGYMFAYPIALCEGADERAALEEITAYCMKENLPEILYNVASDKLPTALRSVRHAEIHAMEKFAYAVEIKTELSMLEADVDFECEGLSFSLPSQKHAEDYYKLVCDKTHNKFYGYEITDDNPNITPADMIAELLREYGNRRSLTLFATQKGKFIGEGVLYDFDGRGSCEISFRVAENMTKKGFGRKILTALVEISGDLGLLALRARVHKDNEISLALLKSQGFAEIREENSVIYLEREV